MTENEKALQKPVPKAGMGFFVMEGIAIFDQADVRQEFNPNVAYELGMLHLLGRDCLILKHQSLTALHTDILMKLYHEYGTPEAAGIEVLNWITLL
jgi:hypothetical protein